MTLECCPSSNVQTGAVKDLSTHPIKLFHDLGLRVTVNTDNRLITDTTVSKELWLCHTRMGFTLDDIQRVIINGFKSSFIPFHVKQTQVRRISKELQGIASDVHARAETPTSVHDVPDEAVEASPRTDPP
ncbi:MAG: adenosine deaminase, partial [Myxococcota bacterium]